VQEHVAIPAPRLITGTRLCQLFCPVRFMARFASTRFNETFRIPSWAPLPVAVGSTTDRSLFT
jgi:hypothetical protein